MHIFTLLVSHMVLSYLYAGVEAQHITIVPPKSTTVTLGGTATFSCTAASSYVGDIGYVVSNVDPSMWPSRGIKIQLLGLIATVNLTVLGTMNNNGLLITCRIFFVNGSHEDITPPAELTVQGGLIIVLFV